MPTTIKLSCDGSDIELGYGKPISTIAGKLDADREVVAYYIDDVLYDLHTPVTKDGRIVPVKLGTETALEILRHSTSHVMAQAAQRLFPGVKLAIGPAIRDGFYYDFEFPGEVSTEDFEKIEREMARIIEEDQRFERYALSRDKALEFFDDRKETYKIELINSLEEEEEISLYKNGDFTDLCRGPHIPSTGFIKSFKILNLAGAYWRGDERNPMLTRIYGTSFFDKKALDAYLNRLEEAKRRDHRKLGRELELFSFHDEGPGFAFWLPNGMVLRNLLLEFWRKEHAKAGYVEVSTPIILKKDLWVKSGHWDNYRENMYTTEIDEYPFAIKPMNCPGGMLIYKEKIRSYRDLPMKVAEVGLVHRHEKSGVLQGLFRVRSFTQDDAHIFMLPVQIEDEIIKVIELTDRIYSIFGFVYHLELSTRPQKSIGTDEQWETATRGLENALKKFGKDYKVNPGEGAFYGPKIDFHLEDCLGRLHQCATIQLDMSFPERFDLSYINSKGAEERPVVIHRTVLGSIERFIGILIEHYGGRFPLWLAPVQLIVLPITERHAAHARGIRDSLFEKGFRVELDDRSEKLGYKMREAETRKIPYIVVIGEKEIGGGTLSVRKGGGKDMGPFTTESLVQLLDESVSRKSS
jgi:threonyl-tRNA synthetase